MSAPLISVIVPVFNAAPFLDELCQSIRGQTYMNFEALFLDDGSSDDSSAVLARYSTDSRFKITSWKQNRGVMAATVELLRTMRGDFWCHPGADDVLEPEFLRKRLEIAQRIPEASIIHGPGLNIDETGKLIQCEAFPGIMPEILAGGDAIEIMLEHNIINTPSVFINSSVTRKILEKFTGTWRYAQDWFLWVLHIATGRPLVWHSERLHRYRVHAASLTMNPQVAATRLRELRLVPLCALATAQCLSPAASICWRRWRYALYALWLRRALKLSRMGQLECGWVATGARAFYGTANNERSIYMECIRHLPSLGVTTWREMRARRRTRFEVAGLAQVGNPLFK